MIYKYLQQFIKASFLLLVGSQLNAQTVYTFTNCTATGLLGPSQTQANAEYASTNLSGQVTVTAGIQYWQVPSSGVYTIEAVGAKGGGVNGGRGARMIGEFTLTAGQTLKILVGQQGSELLVNRYDYSGGGGSFVTDLSNNPFVVAGGGGGGYIWGTSSDGSIGTAGMNGAGGHSNGLGGTAGQGGTWGVQTSDGGAGLLGNGGSGNPNPAPQSFINGGSGGCNSWASGGPCVNGGFGGGGGTNRNSLTYWSCGAGGGYSGGGAAYGQSSNHPYAGGGGSINTGTNQSNTSGYGTGDGKVIITFFPSAPNDAGVSFISSPTSNCVGTYPVTAQIYNAGTNQIANLQVNWSINGVPQTPYAHSTLLDTSGGTGPNSANINLGSITLAAATSYNIKVWTLQPNGTNDTINTNDTALKSVTGYAYPTVNIGPDVSICPTDSATLNAGSGYDSVLWSNAATAQIIKVNTAMQYKVTVYKNGCASSDSLLVNHYPAAPPVNLGPDTTICFNDSIVLDATAAGVSYTWQNSSSAPTQTVSAAGLYSVILEDGNGCKSSDSITITIHTTPSIFQVVSPGNSVCYGTALTFTAIGQSQGSKMYQWKINGVNSGSPTANNTFTPTLVNGDSVSVDLISDLCVSGTAAYPSNTIKMAINPEPRLLGGADTAIENTTEIYAVAISSTTSYFWSVVGGIISGPTNLNTVTVNWGTGPVLGKVICEETDNKNCTYPNEKEVYITSTIGIKEGHQLASMGYAYPNPARTSITIPLESSAQVDISVNLFDVTGKIVKSIYQGELSGSKKVTFDVTGFENGMYFYKMNTSDGYEVVRKISIQH